MNRRPDIDAVVVLARALEQGSFFRVVVPSLTPGGRRLSVTWWTEQTLRIVLPLVGGSTELRAIGHWIDGRGRVTREPVRLLDFYVLRPFSRDAALGLAVALESLALRMRQEALAVAVEHRLYLMRPAPRRGAAADSPSRRLFLKRAAMADSATRARNRVSRSSSA